MKNDYLKRFELQNLEKDTVECQKIAAQANIEAIVPIGAEMLLRMIKEIKRRRFLSHYHAKLQRDQVVEK